VPDDSRSPDSGSPDSGSYDYDSGSSDSGSDDSESDDSGSDDSGSDDSGSDDLGPQGYISLTGALSRHCPSYASDDEDAENGVDADLWTQSWSEVVESLLDLVPGCAALDSHSGESPTTAMDSKSEVDSLHSAKSVGACLRRLVDLVQGGEWHAPPDS
jgi:hypothetical protein